MALLTFHLLSPTTFHSTTSRTPLCLFSQSTQICHPWSFSLASDNVENSHVLFRTCVMKWSIYLWSKDNQGRTSIRNHSLRTWCNFSPHLNWFVPFIFPSLLNLSIGIPVNSGPPRYHQVYMDLPTDNLYDFYWCSSVCWSNFLGALKK